MIEQYKGHLIGGRQDFKIVEPCDFMIVFMYDPERFNIYSEDIIELESTLMLETHSAISLGFSLASIGLIVVTINQTIAKFFTKEEVKDYITKYIFDHRIDDEDDGS